MRSGHRRHPLHGKFTHPHCKLKKNVSLLTPTLVAIVCFKDGGAIFTFKNEIQKNVKNIKARWHIGMSSGLGFKSRQGRIYSEYKGINVTI